MTIGIAVCLLVAMMFCHIVDDYYLQGWLASAKQKSWWEKNTPDKLYKHDYIAALICHAFSWSVMITLPLIIYMKGNLGWFWFSLPVNWTIHALVDNWKANLKKINLITDQSIHLGQILLTWGTFLLLNLL